MKKRVRVVIEKEFDIEIDDEILTEEALEEFREGMFYVDGVDGIFEYVAYQCFDSNVSFVEGVGGMKNIYKDGVFNVVCIYDDTEVYVSEVV